MRAWVVVFITLFVSNTIFPQDKTPEGFPKELWYKRLKADTLVMQIKDQEAIAMYRSVLAELDQIGYSSTKDPYLGVIVSLADAHVKAGNPAQATVLLDPIEQAVSDNAVPETKAGYFFVRALALRTMITELDRSMRYFKQALALENEHDLTGSRKYQTLSYLGEIHTYFLGQQDSAIYYFEQSLQEAIKLYGPVHHTVSTEYARMAESHRNAGRITQSLSLFKKSVSVLALELDTATLDGVIISKGYDSLTVFLGSFLDEIKRKQLVDRIHPADLSKFLNMSFLLTEEGQLELSEDYFNLTASAYEKHGAWPGVANSYNGLGNVYLKRHQYSFARQLYDRAVRTYLSHNLISPRYQIELAYVYSNIAVLYAGINEVDSALHYQQKALDIRRTYMAEPNYQIGNSYINIANNLFSLERFEEAIALADRAAANGYGDKAEIFVLKGQAFQELDMLDSALYYFRQSVQLPEGRQSYELSLYLRSVGEFFQDTGQPDSALVYYNRSMAVNYNEPAGTTDAFDPNGVVNPIEYLLTLTQKIKLLVATFPDSPEPDFLKTAKAAVNAGINLAPLIRSSFVRENENLNFNEFMDEFTEVSLHLLSRLHELGEEGTPLETAMQLVDLSNSQIVLNAIKTRKLQNSTTLPDLQSWVSLKKSLIKEEGTLRALKSGSQHVESITRQQNIVDELEGKTSEVLREIRTTQPQLYQVLSGNFDTYSLPMLDDYLTSVDGALLTYFFGEEQLYMLLRNAGKTQMYSVPMADSIQVQAQRLIRFVNAPQSTTQQSYAQYLADAHLLYQTLIAPVRGELTSPNLIIIPDDYLALLPFDALLTKPTAPGNKSYAFNELPYLLHELNLSFASSASILLESGQSKRSGSKSYNAWAPFSDSTETTLLANSSLRNMGLEELPFAGLELEALRKVFDGKSFFKANASESSFKQHAAGSDILHIATHAIANDSLPEEAHLLFGTQQQRDSLEDNKLYSFEVYTLALDTELAVLTACNTGAGQLGNGEGVMSLARAFKYAGARSVMMSLWLANDQSTASIIEGFYTNLSAGQDKSTALRNARLSYLSEADNAFSHPFYWSHLLLSGDRSALSSTSYTSLLYALGLALFIGIFVFAYKRFSKVPS